MQSVIPEQLRVGGVTPLTTIDFPDHLSCVVFCQGCSWRCRYCHNPSLLPTRTDSLFDWGELLAFLEKRIGLLEAVVFSGGEPLLQAALLPAMKQVKALGFKVGLHSGGSVPARFADTLAVADWVGFDVKDLPMEADRIIQVNGAGQKNWQSLRQLLDSGVDYECRTTVHWQLMSEQRLIRLTEKLAEEGVENYAVQLSRTSNMLDPDLGHSWIPAARWQELQQQLRRIMPGIRFVEE